jgi:axial budding pattern protein 2
MLHDIRAQEQNSFIISSSGLRAGKMAPWRAISAAAIFWTLVDAIPTITYPLNSQVPPVARLSESFVYIFPTSTFFSTLPLTYTLTYGPDWLSLDNSTRTLSGTPADDTLGTAELLGLSFGLTASDSSGSTTLNATLVVSKNTAPGITIPPSTQLQSFGTFSEPSTLLYHPSTPFEININPGTFSFSSSSSSSIFYYAVTTENTPLPAWITFDKNTLSFTGQTPDYYSLIEPPQTFGIQLIASDVEGFGGTSIDFYIEVGVHLFAFKNQTILVNVPTGGSLNYEGLLESLELDGQIANVNDVASAIAQVPPWITFDNSTLGLAGIAPSTAGLVNVTVQTKDIYDDTATAFVVINVTSNTSFTSDIFSRQIGSLNATIGYNFSYDLGLYLNNKSDTLLNAHLTSPQSWLSFNSHTFLLSGRVPSSVQPSVSLITLDATSISQRTKDSQSFTFSLDARFSNSSSESPVPSTPTSKTSQSIHHLSKGAILAISIPIALLFIALLVLVFCCSRRRRAARKFKESPTKSDISSPMGGRPSMAQIVRPGRLNPPEPLQLDTTGFASPSQPATAPENTWNQRASRVSTLSDIRRSQSLMAVAENPLSPLQESTNSGNRARAVSDNGLSKTDSSWRSTQGSAYPTLRSSRTGSSTTQRLARKYSNYSRKDHTKRSAMVLGGNPPRPVMGSVVYSQTREESILGLHDIDFSSTPLVDFSTLARHESVHDTPGTYARKTALPNRTSRRHSKFMSFSGRPLSGLGHGTRPSVSSTSRGIEKRRSGGHGQDWMDGQGMSRNSRTWLTVGTSEMSEQNRRSNPSALSDYSDERRGDANVDPRIRAVTKSPAEPASRANSRHSRPLSRKFGSSPFFAGSSATRNSRKSPKKMRTSYADSPTVPEEATMANNLPAMFHPKVEELPRDSFGISYGRAREGTRQLRSYVQSHLAGTRSRHSMRSTESKDSRFESATSSMLSQPQSRSQRSPERPIGDDGYEDFLRDGFSEQSWETQGSIHASQDNVILFDAEETAAMVQEAAQARRNIDMAGRPRTSASNPVPRRPDSGSGPGIRFMMGAQRRPLSVDASHRASRAVVERGTIDYTAYI